MPHYLLTDKALPKERMGDTLHLKDFYLCPCKVGTTMDVEGLQLNYSDIEKVIGRYYDLLYSVHLKDIK